MRTFIIILSLLPIISFSQKASHYDSLLSNYLYTQVYSEAKTAIKADSTDQTAWQYLARSAQFQYMENIAEKAWQHVLRADSANYEALNGLQKIYRAQNRHKDVLKITRKMDSLLPGQLRNWWILAQTENALKNYKKSIFWCDTITRSYAQFHKAQHVKALNLLNVNDTITALEIWRKLFHNHYRDSYLRQLAYTASSHTWNDTIFRDISAKIKTDSTNAYLHKMGGYLLFYQKNYIDAGIMLREAFDLGDSTDFTRRFLGMAAFYAKDYSTAYYQLSELPGIEENNSLYYMMSFAHARMMANEESIALLEKTYKKYYDSIFISGILGETAETQKRIADKFERRNMHKLSKKHANQAQVEQKKALAMHPSPQNYLRMAMIYDLYTNKKDEALDLYRHYCQVKPDTSSQSWKFARIRIISIKEDKHFMAE